VAGIVILAGIVECEKIAACAGEEQRMTLATAADKVNQSDPSRGAQAWELKLNRRLPLFGHRNWIVVADAAYPAQSNPGIETIVADAHPVHVVSAVLNGIAACGHIRANIYMDREIEFIEESDAPGIADFRGQVRTLLGETNIQKLPHEQIIAKLDQCAQLFRVLILKTDLRLPYTSVFLELDCGYWNLEAEKRLRKACLRG
jgi:L-fucose mutarotase/ribose pyranase (RbsD/FucU family)